VNEARKARSKFSEGSCRLSVRKEYPRLGRPTGLAEVRELTVPRYPYKVYYRVDGDEIWILHIRDARRRPLAER
jgi:plasmid stabilization system protein ParE